MKLLIVGCKGFIGQHVQNSFNKENEVWGCDVYTNYNEKNFFLINPSNFDFKSIFDNQHFDVCINCSGAAIVSESLNNPAKDFELNVHNVFLLLEAIRQHNPKCKFINLSSAAVYGDPKILPTSEDHLLNPLSPYGCHKLQAELLCKEYNQFFGIATCSVRIFSAYGPGLKKQILWDLFLKCKHSSKIQLSGTGDETRDYIFIDDIVVAFKCLIAKGSFDAEVYNLAYGEAYSIKRVSESFTERLGWNGNIAFSEKRREGDPKYWQADTAKIKSLGFSPKVSLDNGIKLYVEWLKSLA